MTILEKVKKAVAEQLEIDVNGISEQNSLIGDLRADSLDIVQMLIAMESEFGIEFQDDEIKELKTVGDVAKFLQSKN
jgi:acyl carrier protein